MPKFAGKLQILPTKYLCYLTYFMIGFIDYRIQKENKLSFFFTIFKKLFF